MFTVETLILLTTSVVFYKNSLSVSFRQRLSFSGLFHTVMTPCDNTALNEKVLRVCRKECLKDVLIVTVYSVCFKGLGIPTTTPRCLCLPKSQTRKPQHNVIYLAVPHFIQNEHITEKLRRIFCLRN
jgi:hypothetical protein